MKAMRYHECRSASLVAVAWHSTEHLVTDPATGDRHHVTVDLPHRFDQLKAPPIIVCLDGAWIAGAARDATRIMSMSREAPEAVVVGVSFDEPDLGAYIRKRARWYTPTGWVPPPQTGVRGVTADDTGKAAHYRAFLRDRVLPLIAEQAGHGPRWLVGHSFSALFGLHTLFTEPAMFTNYLLASPSIWWHDRAILDLEQAWADDHHDLDASVFVSAGAHEGGTSFDDDEFAMHANAAELAERLSQRGYPNLHLQLAKLAGESHSSTIAPALSVGLRALHAPTSLAAVGDQRVTDLTPGVPHGQ